MFGPYENFNSLNKKNTSCEIEQELAAVLLELENSLIKKAVNKIIAREFGKEMPLLADKVYKRLPSLQTNA